MAEKLEFSLERAEIEVDLTDPKTGITTTYYLIELDGKGRDAYLTNISGRLVSGKEGSQTVKNFDGLQSALLSRVLFVQDGDKRKPVPDETIQAWPARVQTALFDKARDMNGLNEDAEEQAGND